MGPAGELTHTHTQGKATRGFKNTLAKHRSASTGRPVEAGGEGVSDCAHWAYCRGQRTRRVSTHRSPAPWGRHAHVGERHRNM